MRHRLTRTLSRSADLWQRGSAPTWWWSGTLLPMPSCAAGTLLPAAKRLVPLMASVKYGGGVVALAGSLGGNTFTRSNAGPFVRIKVRRVHTTTDRQRSRHQRFSKLRARWLNLSDAQRNSWELHAKFLPAGKFTRRYNSLTGWNAYILLNSYNPIGAPDGILSDPPDRVGAAAASTGYLVYRFPTGTAFDVYFGQPDAWRSSDSGLWICDVSKPVHISLHHPPNHWRSALIMKGSASSPPEHGQVRSNVWPINLDDARQWYRVRLRDEFGRIGPWNQGKILYIG